MAYQKKVYRNRKSRGGVEGQCVDSGFGRPGNLNKSAKRYVKNPLVGADKIVVR